MPRAALRDPRQDEALGPKSTRRGNWDFLSPLLAGNVGLKPRSFSRSGSPAFTHSFVHSFTHPWMQSFLCFSEIRLPSVKWDSNDTYARGLLGKSNEIFRVWCLDTANTHDYSDTRGWLNVPVLQP